MIVMSYKDQNLILSNQNKNIEFNIRDDKLTNAIKNNLDKTNGSAIVSIEKQKKDYVLLLDNSIRLRVPDRVGFEIYSRILLLKL